MVRLVPSSRVTDLAPNRLPGRLVDRQLEDIGPGVMADDVEIEPGLDDFGQVEVGDQHLFTVKHRSGQHVAQRADDHAAAAAHHLGLIGQLP